MSTDEVAARRSAEEQLTDLEARAARVRAARIQTVPIPATGHVLYVLHVSDEALADDAGEAVVAEMWRLAEEITPGRAHLAVLTGGLALDVLTDEQLKPLGLQRIPACVIEFGSDA